jgi:hypothetical protein
MPLARGRVVKGQAARTRASRTEEERAPGTRAPAEVNRPQPPTPSRPMAVASRSAFQWVGNIAAASATAAVRTISNAPRAKEKDFRAAAAASKASAGRRATPARATPWRAIKRGADIAASSAAAAGIFSIAASVRQVFGVPAGASQAFAGAWSAALQPPAKTGSTCTAGLSAMGATRRSTAAHARTVGRAERAPSASAARRVLYAHRLSVVPTRGRRP